MNRADDQTGRSPRGRNAVEGILGGLGDILGKISELAERAQSIEHDGDGRRPRFQVGFNIRTMADSAGEPTVDIEPFGNVRRDRVSGEASVTERREPPTDVFEEADHVLVVVEMPGVTADDASFTLEGDVLTIAAERGSKRYAKEVLLPGVFSPERMTVADMNGVFEIRLHAGESGQG